MQPEISRTRLVEAEYYEIVLDEQDVYPAPL